MKNITYYKTNIRILHIYLYAYISLRIILEINFLISWFCYFIFSKKWSPSKHIYKLSNERRKFRGIEKDPTDKIRWTLLDGLKGKASRMKSQAWSWTTGKWLYRFDSIVSRVCVRVWKTKNSKKRGISFTQRTFMTMKREI